MYIQLTQSVGMGKGGGRGEEERERWQAGRSKLFSMFMRPSVRKRRKSFVPPASGLQCLSKVAGYLAMLTSTVEFNGN